MQPFMRDVSVIILLILFAVPSTGWGQEQPRGESRPPRGQGQGYGPPRPRPPRNEPGFSPAQLQLSILNHLGLTEDQRLRIRAIRQENGVLLERLSREVRERRAALDEAIYSENFDETALAAQTAELAEAQARRLKAEIQVQAAIRQILTPDQVRRFRELRQFALQLQMVQQPDRR